MRKANIYGACRFFLLLSFFILTACSSPPQWQSFTTQDGIITLEVPGIPQALPQSEAGGAMTYTMYDLYIDNHAYIFATIKMPHDAVESNSTDKLLDGARNWGLSKFNAALVSEEAQKLDGYGGRYLVFKSKGAADAVGFARIAMADDYLVMVSVIVNTKSTMPSPDVERYLKSIQLHIPKPS